MATERFYTESGNSPPVDKFLDNTIPFDEWLNVIAVDILAALNMRCAQDQEDLLDDLDRVKDDLRWVKQTLFDRFREVKQLTRLYHVDSYEELWKSIREEYGFTQEGLDLLVEEYDPHDDDDFLCGCLENDVNALRLAAEYNTKAQEVQS